MKPEHIKEMDKLFSRGASLRQIQTIFKKKGIKIGVSGVDYHKKKLERIKGKLYPSHYLSLTELQK